MAVDPIANLVAGGLAGAAGTTITCPLEFVKTRLQSTVGQTVVQTYRLVPGPMAVGAVTGWISPYSYTMPRSLHYLKQVLRTEGPRALFKGLVPSLFGTIPTRALYFSSYCQGKQFYNTILPYESVPVHLCAAMTAGICTATSTSPIWVVKTNMQLHAKPGQLMSIYESIRTIYRHDGWKGFYRGLSASYAGTVETALYFVIYEHIKKLVRESRNGNDLELTDCMTAAGVAKLAASCLCYPHEVVRTRLRQCLPPYERRYHTFFQTLATVWREERFVGLYGGLGTHLIRVVPNSAIVFFTYEAVLKLVDQYR